jgi:hypothetical protein
MVQATCIKWLRLLESGKKLNNYIKDNVNQVTACTYKK